MKHRIITVLAAIASAFAMTACLPDGPIKTNYSSMAQWKGGILYTDDNLQFNIVSNGYSNIPDSVERVYIICDVLNQTSDNSYEIQLKEWHKVDMKDLVRIGDEGAGKYKNGEGKVTSDPINVAGAWMARNMLNMNINYVLKKESPGVHDYDLLFNDVKSVGDTVYLQLVHNAHNEYYGNSSFKDGDLKVVNGFVSVPIEDVIPDGKDKIYLKLEWLWHKIENNAIVKETTEYFTTGSLTKQQ